MFKNNRISYFILVVITIILGILSRKIDVIPTYFGDALYAVMMYFGMRFIFVNRTTKIALLVALLCCYGIEFQQIYRADWIIQIRRTSMGHCALGQGFLWSDLGWYTIGVFAAYLFDNFLIKTPSTNLK